jgi:hypothetical protein
VLTLKTSAAIRTNRNIKSSRSCPSSTGLFMRRLEARRQDVQEVRLAHRQLRRLWLQEEWSGHFERAAGSLRVLPPAARSWQTKGGR